MQGKDSFRHAIHRPLVGFAIEKNLLKLGATGRQHDHLRRELAAWLKFLRAGWL